MTKVVSLFPWPQLSADKFEAFWQRYPRRVGKHEAQRAWARLTPTERIRCLQRLPLFIDEWAHQGRERRFILHPSTFINQRRFDDELDTEAPGIVDLGQCMWNINGNRGPEGRCDDRATHTKPDTGSVYCDKHAGQLGLAKRLRGAA